MIIVFIAFFVMMILGMPVAFAIGISGVLFFLQNPMLPLTMPAQLALTQTQNFVLLAIPLFIFSGNLLNETGITKRLIKLSTVLVGHMRADLAQLTVVLSAMMGGVSGSAIADAAMQSRILGPDMDKRGYAKGFSAGIIGYSALIVTAIPPGIGLVLYGSIGEVSIGRLFAGGIVPGLLMTLSLMVTVAIIARKRGYVAVREKKAPLKEAALTFIDSIWAFLFPILLIVGLRFGFFTPSEAGAFAVVYAILVGVLAYKELTWKKFVKTLENTSIDIGMVMFLIAMSGIFGYGIIWDQIPQELSAFMLGITQTPWILTLIIVAFLIIAGMFMDSTVLILLLTSILLPVATSVGMDPVHFGLIMVMTLTIGLLTPPVGVAMYTVCSVMNCSMEEFFKESIPFLIAVTLVVLVMIFFPQVVLFVPNMIFGT